jgi:hypothetical protein
MELPDYLANVVMAAQQAATPLERRRDLQMRKIFIASAWGLGALVATFVLSLLLFRGSDPIPLFTGFPEWGTVGGLSAQTITAQFGLSLQRLANAFGAFLQSGSSGQIAATSRLLTCLIICVAIVFTYRNLLLEHYQAYEQHLQYEDFKRHAQTPWRHLLRVMVALAALVSSYVLLSIVWMLLSMMFKQFAAQYWAAAVFSGLFAGAVTVFFVYWSLTVTTRDLMALGLLTFIAGLSGSFAMAGQQNGEEWWQAAVSRAGADPNADWLFTATFGAVFLIFIVIWFDVKNFLRLIVLQTRAIHGIAPPPAGGSIGARLGQWLRKHAYSIISILYFTAILGLLGVGFVQFDIRDIGTVIAHTGGAIGAILIFNLGGLAYANWFPDPILGKPFKSLSVFCVLVTLVTIILWRVGTLNLAGLELVCLVVVGVWFFFALDNLLTYINSIQAPPGAGPA